MALQVAPERRASVVLGLALVVVGVLALAGRALSVDVFGIGWPLLIIVPGVVLFAGALAVGGKPGVGLAIPGGIVTMVGLVLAVQAATGLWSTWAYAWALVAPGGVGLGLLLYGLLTGQRDVARSGVPVLGVGLALFLAFGLFFEGVIGLNGRSLAGLETILAGGIVVLGVLILAFGATRR
jgi:hypothetical protein